MSSQPHFIPVRSKNPIREATPLSLKSPAYQSRQVNPPQTSKTNLTQYFSPKPNPSFTGFRQRKPSIIELLLAKHKKNSSKTGCLNKTTSTRPATVTSPNFLTEPAMRTPDSFAVIQEKLSSNTPKIGQNGFKVGSSEIIENYQLGAEIGKGAYAVVRLGRNLETSSKVAIKIYEKAKMTVSRKKNAEREVNILEKLSHVNIVKLFKTIENSKSLNLIMEYINGCSLMAYVKKRPKKRLEEGETKRILKQLLSGLEYCHSLGITHRDIKLENILIDAGHVVKIIDFGFSTCFSNDRKLSLFCGTPNYMSPEIVNRLESHGPPSDIWAAGIVLFVLLTGIFPFKAPHSKELYNKISRGAFLLPNFVSNEAKSLITAMLQTDPLKRPSAKLALDFAWFKISPILKANGIGDSEDVPQIRVSLNNTYDQGKGCR